MTDLIMALGTTTLILMIYTILYRENPAFRLGEHLLVGATVGNAVVLAIFQIRDLAFTKVQQGISTGSLGKIAYVIPIILGIALYMQFSKTYKYISRLSIAFMLAVGISLSARGLISVNVIGQIKGAIVPLTNIQNIVYTVGVISVLLYFVYEERVSKAVGPIPKLGRYLLMITMGAYFANSIMGRLSMVIGTLDTLLVAPNFYLIPVALLILIADAWMRSKKTT
ncbi:hypothetical protein E2P71_04965 [Candidatus Bathyarchaeota archaeon]|nr:hypothetical protein E2P71_04965 [Candidatus Bathyarchaeota archaeon]